MVFMGHLVSLHHACPSTQASSPDHSSHSSPPSPRPITPPFHINLSTPQVSGAFVPPPNPSSSPRDSPFDSPPSSPPLPFYTAPSTPLTSPQTEIPPQDPPSLALPQLSDAVARLTPSPPPPNTHLTPPIGSLGEIEATSLLDAQSVLDTTPDFTLDDEGLNTLEKIYLFSRSRSAHHRCVPPLFLSPL